MNGSDYSLVSSLLIESNLIIINLKVSFAFTILGS